MSADELPFFFTWSAQKDAFPVEISSGSGSYFKTPEGLRILDLGSLTYQANAGHGNQRIIEAVKNQADRLCLSMPSAVYPEKVELAERLLEIAPPGYSKVFFTLGGSDANETALKIARMVTGRFKAIARYRSYHGATMGAASLSGDWRRVAVEPGLPGVLHVLDDMSQSRSRIADVLDYEGSVGAVFVESVVGANGVLIPTPEYMRSLRNACDAHGALLVFDEVLVGFGRTGSWFAFEHFEVAPDMITCGKALTAGYGVLGAVLVHKRVASHFESNVLASGLTHYAHPLGVAAALAALKVYEEDGLIERAAELEPSLRDALIEWRALETVGESRVLGLLSGTELHLSQKAFRRLPEALWRRGVHAHVKPGPGVLVLSPPLSIELEELQEGLAKVREAIEEVSKEEA
ncbi:MAG: aspartate aminotransferase family protein [Myxococcota bacterium]